MDYGKVAYMRTEDFAKRLAGIEREQTNAYGMTLLSSKIPTSLSDEKVFHHILSSSENAACQMIFHVKVTSDNGGKLSLFLSIADVEVLREDVFFDKGERDAFFAVGASVPRGSQSASIKMSGNFTLVAYDLMIFGGGITSAKSEFHFSVGASHVLVNVDGIANIYEISNLLTPIKSVLCDIASLYVSNGSDYIVFVVSGTAFGSAVSSFAPQFIASGVSDCVGLGGARYIILCNGCAYAVDGLVNTRIPAPSTRILGLLGVSDSPEPAVLFRLVGGRIFYKSTYPSYALSTLNLGGVV